MGMTRSRLLLSITVSLFLASCGDDDSNRFGNTDDLRHYRDALNPIIDHVSAIEAQVQQQAVGSSNVATAANLNAVYLEVRPQLLETLVDFDRLVPPKNLRTLHHDIRTLIILRLDAYRIVMEGFAVGDSTVYATAETQLRQANELIVEINIELCEIDVALGDLEDCRLLAGQRRREFSHPV
tara:strand:+ start:776 stop:1321 length:546 start_codon:yes stop_codon:yes gene_type:complete